MAILQTLGSDKILRINDFNTLGLVQDLDYTTNFNAQDVNEMGNTARLDTEKEIEVQGSFTINASGALPGLLARMAIKRNATTKAFEGYVYASGGAEGKNGYTFTETDVNEIIFNLLEHERPDSNTFSRTVAIPRAFLTGLSCRVDANGRGQTTVNFAGDYHFGAQNPYHDIRVLHAVRTTDTTATLAVNPGAGWTVIYAYVNERRLDTDNTQATYLSNFNTGSGVITFTTTEGFAMAATDIVSVWFHKDTPRTAFPSLSVAERSTSAYFMKGYQVSIFLAPSNIASVAATEQWLRVQSLDWNVDLRVEVLRQIAYNKLGTSVYARLPTTPFNIQMNASITETDWDDWQTVMNKTFDGLTLYQNIYDWSPANQKGSFGVVVKYYTTTGTLLTEWRFRDMRINDPGNRASIGGRGEITWGLVGNTFTLIGFNG